MRLNNKTAIVTGGASGFGKGIVEKFIKEGANVVIADINYDLAKKLEDSINTINNLTAFNNFNIKVDITFIVNITINIQIKMNANIYINI